MLRSPPAMVVRQPSSPAQMPSGGTAVRAPEQRNATLRRVLEKIRPYGFFVVCSLIVAAVSVAAQLYIPILCGSAIDMMLGKGNVDFNGVLRIVVEIVIVAAPPCSARRPHTRCPAWAHG